MKISDLRAGMNGVNITARVVKVVEKTEVETRFGRSRHTVVELSDETGSVRLNLWSVETRLLSLKP